MSITIRQVMPASVRYVLVSAMGFAMMTACVKAVSLHHIPVLEIVAARALISGLLSYVDIKRKGHHPLGNNKPLLFARGLAGASALFFVYYAVTRLPLAEATVLQYTHPVFTALLALIFLKESVQRSTIACISLSLLGLMVLVSPNFHQTTYSQASHSMVSVGAALLGAFGSAIAYVLVKKLTVTDDGSVIIFYFPLVALPFAVILGGNDFVMPSLLTTGLLLLVGIFTQVGQIGLTKALGCADASKTTAYSYIQVVFSMLLGWLLFSEVPTLTTLSGGGLIIAGALINALWKR